MGRNANRNGEITKKILVLLANGSYLSTAYFAPGSDSVGEGSSDWRSINRKRLREAVYRLQKQGVVDLRQKGEETPVELTAKGKEKIKRYILDELDIEIPSRWDGLWRIVMFDIPELKRKARKILNQKLRQMGFYQIQRSVFVHPFECRDEIEFMKEALKLDFHVIYITAKSIDREEEIKDYYIKTAAASGAEGAMKEYFDNRR